MSDLQWMLTIAMLQARKNGQQQPRGRRQPGAAAVSSSQALTNGDTESHIKGDTLRRSLRVFLSSTFLDFGPERDLFATRVFPSLSALCAKRGVVLAYVDLRWGVTAEQTQSAQTIGICLDQVSSSEIFLGFLGERYGWHRAPPPGASAPWGAAQQVQEKNALLARSFASASARYPWIMGFQDRSVTEIEVRHAVLNQPRAAAVARMYFKASKDVAKSDEGEEAAQKLRQLKAEVRQHMPHVLEYHSLAELEAAMLADLTQVIDRMFPVSEVPTKWERERSVHQIYANSHTSLHIGRPLLFSKLTEAVLKGEKPTVAVVSAAGAGKTALLANWGKLQLQAANKRVVVVSHFVGSTAESTDYAKVLRRLLFEFSELYPGVVDPQLCEKTKDEDVVGTFGLAARAAAAAASENGSRLVIVLDGLDFLEDRDNAHTLWWLRGAQCPNLGLVVAGRVSPTGQWDTTVPIPQLEDGERRKMLTDHLHQFGKALTDAQLNAVARTQLAGSPFFLRLLAAELCVFGSFEKLDTHLQKYLAARDIREMYALVLHRLEADFGKDLVHKLMAVLSVACIGCTEAELLSILNVPPALLCALLTSIESSLLNRAGAYALDASLNEAVSRRYLVDAQARLQAHSWLADYFQKQQLTKRVCRELPVHLERSGRFQELQELLSRTDALQMLFTRDHKKFEFFRYWRSSVAGTGADPAKLYQQTVRKMQQQSQPKPEILNVQRLIASFLADFGNLAGARTVLEEVCKEAGQQKETGHDLLALATVLEKLGQFSQAEELTNKLAALWRDSKSTDETAAVQRLLALLHKKQGRYKKALSLIKEALHSMEAKLGAGHVSLACYHSELGDVYRKLGEFDKALDEYRRVLKIQEQAFGADNLEVAEARYNFAQVLKKQGKYAESKEMVKQSIRVCESLLGADHIAIAPKLSLLADLARKEDDYVQAETLYNKVIEMSKAALGPEHVDVAEAMMLLGLSKKKQGQYMAAGALFTDALRIMRQGFGEKHPKVANVLGLSADNERKLGNLDTAEKMYQQALAINRKVLGSDHPEVADNLKGLGAISLKRGNVEEAERCFTKALQIVSRALGKTHGHAAELYSYLGDAHRKANNFHNAKEAYMEAIKVATIAFGNTEKNAEAADGQYKLGLLFKKYHWFSEAELWLGKAMAGIEACHGRRHPKFALAQQAMGDVMRKFGNYERAEALYEEALGTNRQVFGDVHEEVAQCLSGLGQVYAATSRHEQALETISQSIQMTSATLGKTSRHLLNRMRNLVALLRSMGRPGEASQVEKARNLLLQKKAEDGQKAVETTETLESPPSSPLSGTKRPAQAPFDEAFELEEVEDDIGEAAVMYL